MSRLRTFVVELRKGVWSLVVIAAALTVLTGKLSLSLRLLEVFAINLLITTCIGLSASVVYMFVVEERTTNWPRWSKPLVHAGAIAVAVAVGTEVALRILGLFKPDLPLAQTRLSVWRIGAVVAALAVLVTVTWERLKAHANAAQLREQAAQRELLRARLENLQARLNPHFLFNSLNTVAALVEEDPPRAVEAIERLSELLRYALEGASQGRVPLRAELDAVRAYLGIEALRFDGLEVEIESDPGLDALPVPPLLLQPIVENAVKHGIAHADRHGRVRVRVRPEGNGVAVRVDDDGSGTSASDGTQLGHKAVRERLGLCFGDRARFEAGPRQGGGYRVELWMPTDALAAGESA